MENNLEYSYEKIQQVQKFEEEMNPPKKSKIKQKKFGNIYPLILEKNDNMIHANPREEEYRLIVKKNWFSRTKKQHLERNQTFLHWLKVPYPEHQRLE